jgi:hypothetical protein
MLSRSKNGAVLLKGKRIAQLGGALLMAGGFLVGENEIMYMVTGNRYLPDFLPLPLIAIGAILGVFGFILMRRETQSPIWNGL